MRQYFNDIKDELYSAIDKCGVNLNNKNEKVIYSSKNTNKTSNRRKYEDKLYVSIDDGIKDKIREAYSFYPSYRGLCKNVLGFGSNNSYTYHAMLNGTIKSISKHRLEKLDKFLEVERKRLSDSESVR